MANNRERWGTKLGFILAATGSAIGLGNIWKFPYITGDYGGGAFVLVYLMCVVLIGLPLMITELIIGRGSNKNVVGAFKKLHREKSSWQIAGWMGVASGFVILSYYSVVAGWSLAYIFKSIAGFTGTPEQIQGGFLELVLSPAETIKWHTIFMILTIGIVIGGVKGGIERWSKILMPMLFTILLGLMLYGLFATNGGAQAVDFLFNPDFSKLTAEAILSAMGHAFFTLSIGMGAMITYGSYMRSDQSLMKSAIIISFLDTLIALMAGIAIFSLVFHYGMEPGQSVGLIFKTLPVLFAETGKWISVPFFVLLSFAALTSAISLLEVVVAYFVDEKKWSRPKATLLMGGLIYCVGLLCSFAEFTVPFRGKNQNFFDIFDYISTNYMLPLGGLLTCLFIAWVVKDKLRTDQFGSKGGLYDGLILVLKYVTPIAVFIVLLHGLELLPLMDY